MMNSSTSTLDIVDTAVAAKFNTLVAAVKAADLVATLKGPGPFTVLAPSDEAFSKLPPGTVESLLEPENKAKLQSILTYHVTPGRILSQDIAKLHSSRTASGHDVGIEVVDGHVMVGGARVTTPDVEAANGVIHAIDAVLLP